MVAVRRFTSILAIYTKEHHTMNHHHQRIPVHAFGDDLPPMPRPRLPMALTLTLRGLGYVIGSLGFAFVLYGFAFAYTLAM
jgi:hypothetical protein